MSNYDSIHFESQNAIDTVFNLDDNSKNAIGRLWTLYMEANNGSIEIADQQLQNFLNTLQQYIGQPQTMLQVINEEIDEVNLRIVHDNEIFHGGFSLKRRKTGKKRKRGAMKTSRKTSRKKRKMRKTIKGGKDITPYSLNQPSLYNGNTQQELAMRRQQQQQLEMLRRQQQQAIRRQVPIQADPDGVRRQQQDIGNFFDGLR
jgi:lipopolysaccharide assembly outer membrane protein LptD (OstA)